MAIIRIEDIAHVRFAVPDLNAMAAFLGDFGLETVDQDGVLYGYASGDPRPVHMTAEGEVAFLALGLRAESVEDLRRLADGCGTQVENNPAPGGGHIVSLTDPDGRIVEVVSGQTAPADANALTPRVWNNGASRPRVGRTETSAAHPSRVTRLGHIVLDVGDFRACEAWYKDHFGLITSDEIEVAPGMAMGAFLRCDLGETPTDHHTLFLLQHPNGPGFNHAAFEVADLDEVMAGHDHLKANGRTAHWGVGRHILGNQVFDYWKDPWGHTLEHWTDGDLMTRSDGSATATLDKLLGVQWGPQMTMP